MSLIDWKPEFAIGIPAVDAEHRELIETINALHRALTADASHDEVMAGLGEIYARISAHFALEERYMRETGYAALASHKEDHETLLDEIRDIMDGIDDAGAFDEARLADDLERWFTVHFRTHDARLHQHVAAAGEPH